MAFSGNALRWLVVSLAAALLCPSVGIAQSSSTSPTAKTARESGRKGSHTESSLDPGSVSGGVYRNQTLGFTCKIPAGWVLRTDEMNAPEPESASGQGGASDAAKPGAEPASSAGAKVLLAAFSRPPAATGEEVNSSILIAAESVSAYPGLKDAEQYFDPLTEVAKAQGFEIDEDPYEIAVGSKTLVRADFHKDVATRIMRQSTLAMLSHGYAISITVIAGTEDDVEDLIDGLDFAANAGTKK